ncbi:hypothetical protein GCM10011517_04950 [Actibacterium pelagium]|uniref:Uncharacterized protein n=1 Tax=Actibacterium pelagium TaxID=2029103 RepID=A0A917EH03_9RHOB|nr:hypothetical protein GCM10011517_04950 [Actibacterium pelagium]
MAFEINEIVQDSNRKLRAAGNDVCAEFGLTNPVSPQGRGVGYFNASLFKRGTFINDSEVQGNQMPGLDACVAAKGIRLASRSGYIARGKPEKLAPKVLRRCLTSCKPGGLRIQWHTNEPERRSHQVRDPALKLILTLNRRDRHELVHRLPSRD